MKNRKIRVLLTIIAFAFAMVAHSAPVSEELARNVASGFLSKNSVAQRVLEGRTVDSVEAFENLWVANLTPSGHIILSGSTKCKPIISFSSYDFVVLDDYSHYAGGVAECIDQCRAAEEDDTIETHADWTLYTAKATPAKRRLLSATAPAGKTVIVDSLLGTAWNQCPPYDDLSPWNMLSGCMAIAGGQEFRYWRWPWRMEKVREVGHTLTGYGTYTVRLNGFVPFDYDNIPGPYISDKTPTYKSTEKVKAYETAHLVIWMGSLVKMMYNLPRGSGGAQKLYTEIENYWYEQGTVISAYSAAPMDGDKYSELGYTNLWKAIKADLEFGSPINVNSPGHQMVVDGCGTDDSTGEQWISINKGWGGGSVWVDFRSMLDSSSEVDRLVDFQIGLRPQKRVQFAPLPAKVKGNTLPLTWYFPACYKNKVDEFTLIVSNATSVVTNTVAAVADATEYTYSTDISGLSGEVTFTVTPTMQSGIYTPIVTNAVFDVKEVPAIATSVATEVITDGEPAAAPIIESISAIGGGLELLQDGFFLECGMGITNKITVTCSASTTALYAWPSHLSMLPDDKVSVTKNGNVFTVLLDATDIDDMDSRFEGNMMLLTLKVENADHTEAFKNLMLRFNSTRNVLCRLDGNGSYKVVTNEANDAIWLCRDNNITIDGDGGSITYKSGTFLGAASVTLVNGNFGFENLAGFSGTLICGEGASFFGTLDGLEGTVSGNVVVSNGVLKVSDLSKISGDAWVMADGKLVVNSGDETNEKISLEGGTLAIELTDEQVAYGYTYPLSELPGNDTTLVFVDKNFDVLSTNKLTYDGAGKTWLSSENATYTAKWVNGYLPDDGDYVYFKPTGNRTLAMDIASGADVSIVKAKINGQNGSSLRIEDDDANDTTGVFTVGTLYNTIPVTLASQYFEVAYEVVPSANIIIAPGYCLYCDVDSELSGYITKSGGTTALTDPDIWHGTVAFTNSTLSGTDFNDYGNSNSVVRLSGVEGGIQDNNYIKTTLMLVDYDTNTPAFHLNTGSDHSTNIFSRISGTGTFKISGNDATTESVIINDITDFEGSLNLAAKTVAIGTVLGTKADNGRLNVNADYDVKIAGGKTWTIGGGVYLHEAQKFIVDGSLTTASVLATEGNDVELVLAPTSSVRAASFAFTNGTISFVVTQKASPNVVVSGEANLTGTTFRINPPDGIRIYEAIPLIAADSFVGVNLSALQGLDGHSLEIIGNVLFAVPSALEFAKEELTLFGPRAIAVWDRDLDKVEKYSSDGYTLFNWQTNSLNNSIAVIDRPNAGLLFDSEKLMSGITVLVRYSNLYPGAGVTNKVLFSSCVTTSNQYDRTGIQLKPDGTLIGLWNLSTTSNSNKEWGDASGAIPSSGVMAFTYSPSSGTYLYYGEATATIDNDAVWSASGLKSSSDNGNICGVAIGGMNRNGSMSNTEAAKGMTVSAFAVFNRVLSVGEMKAYVWPSDSEHISVTCDTTVSDLNNMIAEVSDNKDDANYLYVNIAANTKITVDTAFYVPFPLYISSPGSIELCAEKQPNASWYSSENFSIDFSSVHGAVFRSWLMPGVMGFNFDSNQGPSTEDALIGGSWDHNSNSANGTHDFFADGVSRLSWASSTVYSYNHKHDSFLNGYLDDGAVNGNGAEIKLTNIPYETYDVIIYASSDTDNADFTAKTVNGKTYTWDNDSGKVVEGSDNWGHTRHATPVYGTNALYIANLTGPLTIYGGAKNTQNGNHRGGISAFQIIPPRYKLTLTGDIAWSKGTWTTASGDPIDFVPVAGRIEIVANAEATLTIDEDISIDDLTITGDYNDSIIFDIPTEGTFALGKMHNVSVLNVTGGGTLFCSASDTLMGTVKGSCIIEYAEGLLPDSSVIFTDSAWTGTNVFTKCGNSNNSNHKYVDLSALGNDNSFLKMPGYNGYLANDKTCSATLIIDEGTVFNISNGDSKHYNILKKVVGSGKIIISGDTTSTFQVVARDFSEFSGEIQVLGEGHKGIVVGAPDNWECDYDNYQQKVVVAGNVTIASGKTWDVTDSQGVVVLESGILQFAGTGEDPAISGLLALTNSATVKLPANAAFPYRLSTSSTMVNDGSVRFLVGDVDRTSLVVFDNGTLSVAAVAQDSAGRGYCSIEDALAAIKADQLTESPSLTTTIILVSNTNESVVLPQGYTLNIGTTDYKGSVSCADDSVAGIVYDSFSGTYTCESRATATWVGAGTDSLWSNPTNWSTRLVPTSVTTVTFTNDAVVEIPGDGPTAMIEIYGLVVASGKTFTLQRANNSVGDQHQWGTLAIGAGQVAGGGTVKLVSTGIQKPNDDSEFTIDANIEFLNSGDDSFIETANGSVVVNGTVMGSGFMKVKTSTTFNGNVTIPAGSTLQLEGAKTYQLGNNATLSGAGKLVFVEAQVHESFTNALQNSANWTGTCELKNVSIDNCNLSDYGNVNSYVAVNGLGGSFVASSSLNRVADGIKGLKLMEGGLTNGISATGHTYVIAADLIGSGPINLNAQSNCGDPLNAPASIDKFVFTGSTSNFTGQVRFNKDLYRPIYNFAAESDLASLPTPTDYGQIIVMSCTTVDVASEWNAPGGFIVDGNMRLASSDSCLTGECTVTGSGTIKADYVPSADGTAIRAPTFADDSANTFELKGMTAGWISNASADGMPNINATVKLLGDVRITNGYSANNTNSNVTTFKRLTGSGDLKFAFQPNNSYANYAITGVESTYSGTITLASTNAYLRIGAVNFANIPSDGSCVLKLGSDYRDRIVNADGFSLTSSEGLVATTTNGVPCSTKLFLDTDGLYVAVASVGSNYYTNLTDAVEAVGSSDDVINLLADTDEEITVPAGETLRIKKNGFSCKNVTIAPLSADQSSDVDEDGVTVYRSAVAKAAIGENYYSSLSNAVENASSVATNAVRLLANDSENVVLNDEKAIIFEQGGFSFSGTLAGNGTIIITNTPSSTTWVSSRFSEGWTGTVYLKNVAKDRLNLNNFGTSRSTVRMTGCSGYLSNDSYAGTLDLQDDGDTKAFTVNNAGKDSVAVVRKLTGSGTLSCAQRDFISSYVFKDATEFRGSINSYNNSDTNKSRLRVILGDGESIATPADSTITVLTNVTIAAGKTWTAPGGILLLSKEATVTVENTATTTPAPTLSEALTSEHCHLDTSNDGGNTVYSVAKVAQDSAGTHYCTIADALAAIEDNPSLVKTITLIYDTDESVELPVGYTLHINNKNYTGSVTFPEGAGLVEDASAGGSYTCASRATAIWTGDAGDGRWANPTNWSPRLLPTANTAVTLATAGTIYVTGNNGEVAVFTNLTVNADVELSITDRTNQNDSWPSVGAYGNISGNGSLTMWRTGIRNKTASEIVVGVPLSFDNNGTNDSYIEGGSFKFTEKVSATNGLLVCYKPAIFEKDIELGDNATIRFAAAPSFGESASLKGTGTVVKNSPDGRMLELLNDAENWKGVLEITESSNLSNSWASTCRANFTSTGEFFLSGTSDSEYILQKGKTGGYFHTTGVSGVNYPGRLTLASNVTIDNGWPVNSSGIIWPEDNSNGKTNMLACVSGEYTLSWTNGTWSSYCYYGIHALDGDHPPTLSIGNNYVVKLDSVDFTDEPTGADRKVAVTISGNGKFYNADKVSMVGATNAIDVTVGGMPSAKKLVFSDDGLYLAVASVNANDTTTYYMTLLEAAEHAVDGCEITLLSDTEDNVEIPTGWTLRVNTNSFSFGGVTFANDAVNMSSNTIDGVTTYTSENPSAMVIGSTTTYYSSLSNAVEAASVEAGVTNTVRMLAADSGNVVLNDKAIIFEENGKAFSGTLSGNGTLIITNAPSSTSWTNAYFSAVDGQKWTGTFVVGWDISGKMMPDKYGISNSTVKVATAIESGYFNKDSSSGEAPSIAPALYFDEDVKLSNGFAGLNKITSFAKVGMASGKKFSTRGLTNKEGDATYYMFTVLSGFAGEIEVCGYDYVRVGSVELADTPAANIAIVKITKGTNAHVQTSNGVDAAEEAIDVFVEGEVAPVKAVFANINDVSGLYKAVAKISDVYYVTYQSAVDAYSVDDTIDVLDSTADGIPEGWEISENKLTKIQCTIKFVDEDGTDLSSKTYDYGTVAADIVKPDDPTKAATAQYTYTFNDWSPALEDVISNTTYTATYDETVNSYTVTWDVNGVKTSETYIYGQTPSYSGSTDKDYYTFTGWAPAICEVAGDATYTAQYAPVAYSITYEGLNGASNPNPATYTVEDAIEFFNPSSVYGFVFDGWTPAYIPAGTYGPQTVKANWSLQKFDVTINGITKQYDYQSSVNFTAPEPVLDESGTMKTIYIGTSSYPDSGTNFNLSVTSAISFTWDILATNYLFAVYETENGSISGIPADVWLPDGTNFTLTAVASNNYHFVKWTGNTDNCVTTENEIEVTMDEARTIGAEFAINTYAVKFVDYDGTELSSESYDYGTAAADIVKPDDPTKADDGDYAYTFTGWMPTIGAVTGDATYTAIYSSTGLDHYTITPKSNWFAEGARNVDCEHTSPDFYTITNAAPAGSTTYRIETVINELIVNTSTNALPIYSGENIPYASIAPAHNDESDYWFGWDRAASKWQQLGASHPVDGGASTNAIEFAINDEKLNVTYSVDGVAIGVITNAEQKTLPSLTRLGFSGYGRFQSYIGEGIEAKFEISTIKEVEAIKTLLNLESADRSVIEAKLAEKGANGLRNWQNVVLGLPIDDTNKKPFVAPVQNANPGTISFAVGNCVPNDNLRGKSPKFQVYEVTSSGAAVSGDALTSGDPVGIERTATIDLSQSSGVHYFKIKIVFE